MGNPRIVIFARFPRPGEVKTRLEPALGPEGAARVYRILLERTLEAARDSGLACEVRCTGSDRAMFAATFGDWFACAEQGDGDLGTRLARVDGPALVVGSDLPAISPELLRDAARALDDAPVVLGPASDGGYWLIGFRNTPRFLFEDMAWSTDRVFAETLRRLRERGIEPALLPKLSDIDEPSDLADWPELAG